MIIVKSQENIEIGRNANMDDIRILIDTHAMQNYTHKTGQLLYVTTKYLSRYEITVKVGRMDGSYKREFTYSLYYVD